MDNYGCILLVEDDVSLAQWISDYLIEQGFAVVLCHRGDEAIASVEKHQPDIVLLDVMLPGKDGISVCRELRAFYHNPILMLTARDDEMDEVIGLEMGASDYITKPVRPRALLARIKAALRDVQTPTEKSQQDLQVGALRINTQTREVQYQNTEMNVSNAEYQLLSFLAEHAGKVLDRDAVFKATKGREYDGLDRSVDVLISALRKKFGDDPQNPKKIKTIWGKGYLLVPDAW